jgi:hypothetical protein
VSLQHDSLSNIETKVMNKFFQKDNEMRLALLSQNFDVSISDFVAMEVVLSVHGLDTTPIWLNSNLPGPIMQNLANTPS